MRLSAKNDLFRYSYWTVALLSALVAILLMLPSILHFNGVFVIRGDYIEQYLTKLMSARRILTYGEFPAWNWTNFLGEPYMCLNLYLSFDLLCLLVPESWLLPAAVLGNVLRFTVAAVTSCAYFRLFVKRENACLGALLYAFSSYSLVALEFAQFNNAAAVFPLLLLGIERLFTKEDYRCSLIFAVALNAHLNPYLFIQSSIFLLIYALIRYFFEPEWQRRKSWRVIVRAIAEYLIGALIAGISLVQFAMTVIGSAKFMNRVGQLGLISFLKLLVPTDILDVVTGLISAGVSNRFDTFGRDTRWLSYSAYVPVFGCSLWIMYLRGHRLKNSTSKCLVVSLLISCLPILNNAFNLYTAHYVRWWYCLVLMQVLISVLAWQELNSYSINLQWWSLLGPIIALIGVIFLSEGVFPLVVARIPDGFFRNVFYLLSRHTGELDAERIFQLFSLVVTLSGAAVTGLLYTNSRLRKNSVAVIAIFLVLYGGCYVTVNNTDRHLMDHAPDSSMTLEEMVRHYLKSGALDRSVGAYSYRIDYPPQLGNYGIAHDYPAVSAFNSEINHASAQAGLLLDYENGGEDVRWWLAGSGNAVRTLLSVRYYFDYYPEDDNLYPVPESFSYVGECDGVHIYKNENYLPIGFTYNDYCLRSELDEDQDTGLLMLNVLVLEDGDETFALNCLKHWDGTLCAAGEAADARRAVSCTDFAGTPSGFTTQLDTDEACVVFFSVPHTDGWTALVDGAEVEIHTVNGGFMALAVSAGNHEIRFHYTNPSVVYGIAVTALGLILLGGYFLLEQKDGRHEK